VANKAFDRTIIAARERPMSSDINQAQAQLDRTLRDMLMTFFSGRVSDTDPGALVASGVVGAGLQVIPSAVPGMSVRLRPGIGFLDLPPADTDFAIGGVGGLDDLSEYKPLVLLSEMTISGISAPVTNPRIDIIEVRMNRVVGNPLSRDVLDTISGLFVSNSVNKSLAFTLDGSQSNVLTPALSTGAVGYKRGAEAASPVAPAVTAGYMKIAEVRLSPATTSLTRGEIRDTRRLLAPYNLMHVSAQFNVPSGAFGPSLLELVAPPGVEVVCRKAAPPAQDYLGFYVIGGDLDANSKFTCQAQTASGALGPDFYPIATASSVASQLDASDVAALNDPTISGPALLFSQFQAAAVAAFFIVHQLNGTTNSTMPASFNIQFQGFLRR
jgi:hypothetical protein